MNRVEYLFTVLSEECAEVTQASSKILRFGLANHHRGNDSSNDNRLVEEFYDIMAVFEMLQADGILPVWDKLDVDLQKKHKKDKVEKYMKQYSNDL